jgi:hypothetical protein
MAEDIVIRALTVVMAVAIAGLGLTMLFQPRIFIAAYFRLLRMVRGTLFRGGWLPTERAARRLGVPRDVPLNTPEDVEAYYKSERYWREGAERPTRILAAGICFLVSALLLVAVV